MQIIEKSQGTPRNNKAQNEQTKSAVRKYNLSKEGQRLLHDTVSGQNYGSGKSNS